MKKSKVIGLKFKVKNSYAGKDEYGPYSTYEILGEKAGYYKCLDLGTKMLVMITKTYVNDLIKQDGKQTERN
jgi:hypothetical protein